MSIRRTIPPEIWVAVAANAVIALDVVAVSFASDSPPTAATLGTKAMQVGLVALVTVGLVLGARLAWQAARLLGGFGGVLAAIIGILAIMSESYAAGAALALAALSAGTVVVAMGRPRALEHFRLVCPTCGAMPAKPADPAFGQAKCRRCELRW